MGLCNTCETKRSGKCEGNKPWEEIVSCVLYQKSPADTNDGKMVTNPNRLTNADRIRAMSDEELAKWLWFKTGKCPPFGYCPHPDLEKPCVVEDCWLDWLKQEVEE